MSFGRVIAGISVLVCVIGITAIGQQQDVPQPSAPKTQLESCREAMPAIYKNYNNAKYAVFLARQGGDHTGNYVLTAQAALDAMEQPLKGCYEAMLNTRGEAELDNKK